MEIHYLPISWTHYLSSSQQLAATILDKKKTIDEIVAISRGGLTFGHLLSDFLRVPISTITIQSYKDIQNQGEMEITQKLPKSIRNKHILLVDDVSDSGKTFIRAVKYLKRFKPASIITVALFYKPQSLFRPDFFAEQTTKWILFPYEPTEMIILITKQMEKSGSSKAEIQTILKKLEYADDQINFVRKYY